MPSPNMQLMVPERDFHIFNRGTNCISIFPDDVAKNIFDSNIRTQISKFAHIYTGSVMDNHFHYVINTKSISQILKLVDDDRNDLKCFVKNISPSENNKIHRKYIASRIMSELLRRSFISYSDYYRTNYDYIGCVFSKSYKRKEIYDKNYLRDCIIYVNRNITNHFPEMDYRKYRWSDYSKFLDINYIQSLESFFDFESLFGNIENFIYLHARKDDFKNNEEYEFILEK
jgi:hypothetical protein